MQRTVDIAFRRKVRAVWLDQGMAMAAGNLAWHEAKPALAESIAAENSGAETIRKVLEHIRRIWFEPPESSRALHSDALALFRVHDSPATRVLLNWGMAVAAYPFVGNVGEALGRLLKLQGEAHRADIQRRLREQHGDRDFVTRITRYDISSFLDWTVIVEAKESGVYLPGKTIRPRNAEEMAWLAEAVIISRGESQMAFSHLCFHPLLFPMQVDALNVTVLRTNPRLCVSRQSLNEDVVTLHAPARNQML